LYKSINNEKWVQTTTTHKCKSNQGLECTQVIKKKTVKMLPGLTAHKIGYIKWKSF